MTTTEAPETRMTRYSDLLPTEKLRTASIHIAGVGAIGRQIALQCAAMGCENITLVDPDVVEEVNLGPQGYCPGQIGCNKVAATAADIARHNPDGTVTVAKAEYQPEKCDVLFIAVDTMQARMDIFEKAQSLAKCIIDGRMAVETMRILICSPRQDPKAIEGYKSTLHTDAESLEMSCTTRSTIYTASIAAGLMISQWMKVLRRMPLDREIILNTGSNDFFLPQTEMPDAGSPR